jgi:glycosyltransferase involved in cell wall biosynthesis
MKILMQNRPTCFSIPGGDTIQMLKTKEYLEKMGLTVDISLEENPRVEDYDLVHVFNMQDIAVQYSYYQMLNVKRQGKPVALSPIYWNFDELEVWGKKIYEEIGLKSKSWNLARRINSLLRKAFEIEIKGVGTLKGLLEGAKNVQKKDLIRCMQVSCMFLADVLLPNAKRELDMLMCDFDIPLRNTYIVPNAADSVFLNCNGNDFVSKHGLRDFVLCVGRIEITKNQLFLIRAMKGSSIPLVLIGRLTDGLYLRECIREADKNVIFLNQISHEELASAYGAAKVHALPSWRETPGLVSLEAGLAGCNIVVTNRGSTEEYFGKLAYYCEPDDVVSIRNAVLRAHAASRNKELVEHIFSNYTWKKAAEKTLEAYQSIIKK